MRTVSLNIPIIGWASATAKVDEDMTDSEIRDSLLSGEIELDALKLEQWAPIPESDEPEFANFDYPGRLEIEE